VESFSGAIGNMPKMVPFDFKADIVDLCTALYFDVFEPEDGHGAGIIEGTMIIHFRE
jgi:hypothetical protein